MGNGNLWVNTDGDVVHPNAPNGGGGYGNFKSATPLGINLNSTFDLPHPFSPVGLNTVPQPGGFLVNDQNFKRLIEAMEEDATEADSEWKLNLGSVLFTFLEPKVLAD